VIDFCGGGVTWIEERSTIPPTLDVDEEETGGKKDERKTAGH